MRFLFKSSLFCLTVYTVWFFGHVDEYHEHYRLEDDYSLLTFFDKFDFFQDKDPTEGYVDYVSRADALESGLIKVHNSSVYLGVDHSTEAHGRGRRSVRMESKKLYNHGLFIVGLYHMPASICGVWPAFWTFEPNHPWPELGELDIIEGVNSQSHNNIALHTRKGCSISNGGDFTGWVDSYDCHWNAPNQNPNAGCKIIANQTNAYGDTFNMNGGGVFAIEWTSSAIQIWFFPRENIPANVVSDRPTPTSWGLPLAKFSGPCELDTFIRSQTLVFNITFCGGWAGKVWDADPICSKKAKTCEEFVKKYPEEFVHAFWGINSLKTFQWSTSTPGR
ncbi:beta-1,3-1,4-glucanase [Paraphoma chrysanthemicola]|uniref:endo-1,3(4)-beta-glucanase n=1 Tax=Paraphoma chrysanthemicola TaxID=798071 RepID=A0A8K0QVV8_9PLEO|nr:beta-1,3-1,4-glucanase [Paraphoma chrysanthemicola]